MLANISRTFLLNIIGALASFGLHLLLARFLDAGDFGIYSFVFSLSVILSFVAAFGFPTLANRLTAAYTEVDCDTASRKGLLLFSTVFAAVTGLLAGILVFGGISLLPKFAEWPALVFVAGICTVPLMGVSRVFAGFFRGLKRAELAVFYESTARDVLLLGFIMIAAFVLMSSPGSVFALILMAVCIGAVSAFSGIHLWKLISLQGGTCVTAYHIKDWLKAAWPMMFVLTLQMLIHRTDVVMLGFLSDAGETGQYAAASKIAQAATLLHIAVINVFSAHAAVHFRKKDYAALKTSYQKVQFLQFAGVLLMAVALALIARPVLGFLGSGFTGAEIIIYLLLAGHVVNALWGPSASLLIMTDYEKPLMRITTFSLATNIMLNLLLIPATGAAGAAIATIVSLNLRNAGSLLYARKIKLLTGGKDHASA